MRWFRPLFFSRWFYRKAIFRVKTTEKVLYLTFDDGPDRETTFPLMRILSDHGIRALFFCSGRAASENQDIVNALRAAGHIIGNHGYEHNNGFTTGNNAYFENAEKADRLTSEKLFRPPFGKMKISQYLRLKRKYDIILWDIMPYDFDPQFGAANSLNVLKKIIRPGSIIALHDNKESTLPEFIEEFIVFAKSEGWRFEGRRDK